MNTTNMLLLTIDPVAAASAPMSGEEMILLVLSGMLLIGMLLVGVVAVYLMLILQKALGTQPVVVKPVDPRPLWMRFAGLQPLSREKDMVLEHTYDGIAELDNPTPPWFMGLFYGTIGIAVVYMLVFHVFKVGDLQLKEYSDEVAIAEVKREAYIAKVAGNINENTVAFVRDTKALDEGKGLYTQHCVACHGAEGQGGVGPNLTDDYWLHGNTIKDVYRTVSEGVTEKGMLSWKRQLNPLQMQQVSSYVLSLHGSSPPNPKEPQGDKKTEEKVAAR